MSQAPKSFQIVSLVAPGALAFALMTAGAGADEFTIDLDALYLARDLPDGVVFGVLADPGVGDRHNVALSTNEINFGFEPGARTTLGWEPSAVDRFEVSMLWVEHDGEAVVFDPLDDLELALENDDTDFGGRGGTDNFRDSDGLTVRLGAAMWNAEANYVRQLTPIEISPLGRFTPSVLGGVRRVQLDEYFSLVSFDDTDPTATAIGTLTIDNDFNPAS